MNDLVDLTIRHASRLMIRREISAVDLVEAILEQLATTEVLVEAFALVLSEQSKRDAQQADTELARGVWRGPLHGIPLGVKDICYTKGIPTRAGSVVLKDFVPTFDSTVVSRLRDAGAIIIGKTTTHEFALGQRLEPTTNPWDGAYYPGGSSVGSGVATAVRSIFGAIGTDTAGSIRSPASINGIVGLKPTYGRVSRYGVIPASPSLDHVGPMARTVEDCALLLQAIAGHDPRDSTSGDWPVDDFCRELDQGVSGLRIGVDRDYYFSDRVQGSVRSVVEDALRNLEAAGADLVEIKVPAYEQMMATGLTILTVEASAVHRRLLRQHSSDYSLGTRLLLKAGELVPGVQYVNAQRTRMLLRKEVQHAFQAYQLDALVAPTLPVPSVPLDGLSTSLVQKTDEANLSGFVKHCIPANVTGQPALSLPCGFTPGGLPIGLQVVGRPLKESTLFRIARTYERANPWCNSRPPIIENLAKAQVK
jgi:aspartyl-tRNA(Asn)/glutamyl-tRNA(Gln) amidotransferase subunit A